jgi:cyclopropane-fatty-acyl-phospholipid synthase
MPNVEGFVRGMLSHADVQIGGGRPWDIHVHDARFYPRVLAEGELGLGEAYMDGWWDCEALDEFFHRVLSARLQRHLKLNPRRALQLLGSRIVNMQTKRGARKVAHQHYDLSAELYMSFLDPYNQYTCAYFEDTDQLNTAQEQKLELICRKLQLGPDDRVLDIGCGWGGFARFAAERYGCHITGITISEAQAAYAREHCAGLNVSILVQDYRDLATRVETGHFDKVLVCGMIEHVGPKNYRSLMEAVTHSLRPPGLFLLHTIGSGSSSSLTSPFLGKYIFPNSVAPSLKQLTAAAEGLLVVHDLHHFGPRHYEKTLMAWFHSFERNWDSISAAYDERFFRMWKYYLLSCAGNFRAGFPRLWQIVLSHGSLGEMYPAVRHVTSERLQAEAMASR